MYGPAVPPPLQHGMFACTSTWRGKQQGRLTQMTLCTAHTAETVHTACIVPVRIPECSCHYRCICAMHVCTPADPLYTFPSHRRNDRQMCIKPRTAHPLVCEMRPHIVFVYKCQSACFALNPRCSSSFRIPFCLSGNCGSLLSTPPQTRRAVACQMWTTDESVSMIDIALERPT